jgi:hypothetical protein
MVVNQKKIIQMEKYRGRHMRIHKIILGFITVGLFCSTAYADDKGNGKGLGNAHLVERIEALESLVVQLQSQINNSNTAIAENAADISTNGDSIAANDDVLQYANVVDGEINGVSGPHFIIEGANVHVRSGAGSTGEGCFAGNATDCPSRTGLGNLIVGYNEPRPSGWDPENLCASDPDAQDSFGRSICSRREGAHHLVVGQGNNFVGHGGAVLGLFNEAKGSHATVTGGRENSAARYSSVSGGARNVATASISSVSGGWGNRADGPASSVTGGENNVALGYASTVGAGLNNIASGDYSVVSGGQDNAASGFASSISGGINSLALGFVSSVSGGDTHVARGAGSSISGGQMKTANADFCTVGDNGTDC